MNLNLMKKIAKMSPHVKYQHCSLIFAGNRLLAYGYNREHVHAEIVAIGRLYRLSRNGNKRPRNLHLVNLMIKRKNGQFGNSYPCDACCYEIAHAKIERVTYFDETGMPIQLGG